MKIALVAGETSGDLLAGLLLNDLTKRWPALESFGIGGARMTQTGFQAWWPSDKLAVRGYVEVLRHYREIVGIRRQLKSRLLAQRPDVFVGVDAPDFNLALAHDLRRAGIPTIQFVSPSIWAWRGERIQTIAQSVDHVLCIFPFEPALYAQHGISASYVGHPLASVIPIEPDRRQARDALGLAAGDAVVAVLPGSRASEIHFIGETFVKTIAQLLLARTSAQAPIQVLLPAVPLLQERIAALLSAHLTAPQRRHVQLLAGQSHLVLAACDVALVASGTATLEAALFKRPMVIAYKMNPLSWWWMRRQRYQPWVGLPNILCQKFVVPEFLQSAATPDALSQSVLGWLDNPKQCELLTQRFTALHHELKRDTPLLAAQAITQVLGV